VIAFDTPRGLSLKAGSQNFAEAVTKLLRQPVHSGVVS